MFIKNTGDPIRSYTFNFDQSVSNLKFSLFDIDGITSLEARAYNNGTLQPITLTSLKTAGPTNTSASASPSTTPTITGVTAAYTVTTGITGVRTAGINVDVPNPVNSFVLASTSRFNGDTDFYVSQISYNYIAPVLPADVTVTCDNIPAPVVLTSTDNCSTANVVYTQTPAVFVPSTTTQTITRTWVATDAQGNTTTHTQIITVNPTTLLTITNPAAVCAPATVNLTAAAVTAGSASGSTLSYHTDAAGTIALANPNAVATSGTYYIKATTATCVDIKPVVVTINAQPIAATVTAVQPTCAVATGSITVTAPAEAVGITYSIDGVTYQASSVFNNVNPGTYQVTYNNGTCISATSPITINAQPATPPAPIAAAPTQPTCATATGSVALSGLPATGTWTITDSNGGGTTTGTGTTTTINGLATGSHTFTVTNSAGCTSVASATVTINAQPATPVISSATPTNPTTCSGSNGSIVLNGLTTGTSYTINYSKNGTPQTAVVQTAVSNAVTLTGLTAGAYTNITATSGACTSAPVSANLSDPSAPSAPIAAAPIQPTCALATGSVALSGLPATGTWTITNSNGGGTTTGTGTTTTINGLVTGSHTFTVTNAAGCTSVASATVTINAQPATPSAPIAAAPTQPTCATATGSVAL
ncbi:MAG: hypothetical protein EOP51_26035, partial [Sphingobacteriales bacterium]